MRLAQVVVAAELVVKGKKQQCVNAAYGTGCGIWHGGGICNTEAKFSTMKSKLSCTTCCKYRNV